MRWRLGQRRAYRALLAVESRFILFSFHSLNLDLCTAFSFLDQ